MSKLTPKQAAFVAEYPKDFNATAAAIRAGYAPRSARQQAARLLTKDDIQAALADIREEARTESILSLRELQEWWSELVRGGKYAEDLRDALKASEYLAKSQGAFTEKVETSGTQRIEVVYVDE